jgi:hypothetical protein
MNIPFDNVVHILEYCGNYNNLLFLTKHSSKICKHTSLHKLYIEDIKKYITRIDFYINSCNDKINGYSKRLKLYTDPELYKSCTWIENLILINKYDIYVLSKSVTQLNKEKKILGDKIC